MDSAHNALRIAIGMGRAAGLRIAAGKGSLGIVADGHAITRILAAQPTNIGMVLTADAIPGITM
jgi:hypothetical protein